jgi:tetratricopeptide (TPR) repeat protein
LWRLFHLICDMVYFSFFRRQLAFLFILEISLMPFFTSAQGNLILTDYSVDYQNAIQHINKRDYAHAYNLFQKILNDEQTYSQSNLNLYRSDALYYSAFLASKLGKYDAEEKLIAQHDYSQGSRKHQLAFHLAELYFEKGNYKNAETWFQSAGSENLPSDWLDAFYFKSAYSFMENGNELKAIASFQKSIGISKSQYSQDARYYLGVLFFNQKDYNQAEKYLTEVSNNSTGKDVNFVLAQIQFFKKNYNKVISLLKEDNLNSPGKNALLGKSYFELKEYNEAQSYLNKHTAENATINAEDMYQLAFSEYKIGLYDQAIGHFRELQLSNNFGQYAMYALADCYLKNKDKQNALNAFIQASSGSQDLTITEQSKLNIAKLNYDLKNYNSAIKNFNDYLKEYPNSPQQSEIYPLLTSSLLFTNNYPQAIEMIEKNEKLQAGNERLYQEICYTYAIQLYQEGNKELSQKFIRKSIANPFDKILEAEAKYFRADIYFKDGEVDKARAEYNEVFKIIQKEKIVFAQNATLFNTYYGLGYCAYLSKDYMEALSQFQNCAKSYIYNQNQPKSDIMQDVDLRVADIYFLQKNYDAAYNMYSKISQARGRGYDYATLQKANIDGVQKNYKEKINVLTKLLREVPNSIYTTDAKYQLALAYEDNNNIEEALRIYSELEAKSGSQEYAPKALVRQATLFFNKNDMTSALTKYGEVLNKYSNSPEADQALKAIKEIYLSQGKAEDFINFVNSLPNGRQIQASEQDTILFEAAEEAYSDGKCEQSISMLNKYLDKFPNGLFFAKARFYKAECYTRMKMPNEAIEEYAYLCRENNNPYYERALVRSAYFNYNNKRDYSKAKSFYQKLLTVATSFQNKQVAKIGMLESSYNLKKYADVVEFAKLIESEGDISSDIKNEAIYYRAKSLFFLKNYKQSLPILEVIVQDKSYKYAAECTYYMASIYTAQGNSKKSNEILLAAKDDFGSYETWVIRYFILIGYNYHKLGDNFQAKATLESIISNYQGDSSLVNEAKEKLVEINNKIKETSKVKYK